MELIKREHKLKEIREGRFGHYLFICACNWNSQWHKDIEKARAIFNDHIEMRLNEIRDGGYYVE